ncbi:GNAT family acetyltransferase [Dokdonella sp.]|uniref:GNAT family acetyltransferase n=1 Tax=Dokdonella sp. TaxID=2291710 RepID=UPI0035293B8D
MATDQHVLTLRGREIVDWLPAVARLRIAVFRDYPYLYDGDVAYEERYLASFAQAPDSVLVLVLSGEQVVGASTGLPLANTEPGFQAPFHERGMPVDEVFYCAESVLLPDYRGLGFGHRFFDEREAHARALGTVRWTSFAAVDRDVGDPRRPSDYRGNDLFWTRRGYVRQPAMSMRLAWKQIGEARETEQFLTFWMRKLEAVE